MRGFIRRQILDPLRDFVCPPVCLTCDTLVDESVSKVCPGCWAGLREFDRRSRSWRGMRSEFRKGTGVDDLIALYRLEKNGTLQEMIHHLKYQGKRSLGIELGRRLGEALAREPVFSSADMLVPVPLHPLKARERGFNQSEFICRGITEASGIPTEPALLLRTRDTETQTLLSTERRKMNVHGAFGFSTGRRTAVRGRRVIVVDDVITTGATVSECVSVLRSGGADAVFAAAVALAL